MEAQLEILKAENIKKAKTLKKLKEKQYKISLDNFIKNKKKKYDKPKPKKKSIFDNVSRFPKVKKKTLFRVAENSIKKEKHMKTP